MKYLSVCSGIEAATTAWHNTLGWEPVAFSEIEKFPAAVLHHHYPHVPNFGDMTKYKEWDLGTDIDLLVGGTPCQSFSVAGLRKGLADPRGNLALVYLGIAERFRPRWILWENVPGVLSSNGGRDFGSFLGALAQLGYGFAYRVLDAQYFGVPQRRRRVFVVGYLGDWRRAAAVLFERHSLSGHPAPSREKREGFAGGVARSLTRRYDSSEDGTGRGLPLPPIGIDEECNATVDGFGPLLRGGQGGTRQAVMCARQEVVGAMSASGSTARKHGFGWGQQDWENGYAIPCHTTGAGFWQEGMGTLRAREQDSHENLLCMAHGQGNAEVVSDGDPSLTCNHEAPILAFNWNAQVDQMNFSTTTTTPTLSCSQGPAVAFNGDETPKWGVEVSPTLRAEQGGEGRCDATALQVRRLTPRECERLQGFPDDYTNTPWGKKECPDGPRYKALGNSMAVPVMRWIGMRIEAVERFVE